MPSDPHARQRARQHAQRIKRVRSRFDREALRRVCQMRETDFANAYGMTTVRVPEPAPNDFYLYKDNGSSVLAVAHLDTVARHTSRRCRFVNTEGGGTVVFSRALDDRLGAYIILELLPELGITYDVLLTTGEEVGRSTAGYFDAAKEYDWMIEFDRGGTDVVMYQYENDYTCERVKACDARVGDGSFSDISYLDHLEVKGFNWGVGYRDYHGPRAHAFLDDTFAMVSRYLLFHTQNAGVAMPHDPEDDRWWEQYGDIDAYADAPDFDEHPSLQAINDAVGRVTTELYADKLRKEAML